MLPALVVSGGKAWLAGSFQAGLQRSEARGDVCLREGEERSLCGKIYGFDVLRNLVECLSYTRISMPHFGKVVRLVGPMTGVTDCSESESRYELIESGCMGSRRVN